MEILPTTTLFRAVSLRDRIRKAREDGVVAETIPMPSSYDEDFESYDPASNIRESLLEQYDDQLQGITNTPPTTVPSASSVLPADSGITDPSTTSSNPPSE